MSHRTRRLQGGKNAFTIQKWQRDIRERLTRTSSVSNLHGPVPELKYSFPFLECAVYLALRSDSVSDGMWLWNGTFEGDRERSRGLESPAAYLRADT